jgi:hypothetical protein
MIHYAAGAAGAGGVMYVIHWSEQPVSLGGNSNGGNSNA